MRLREMSGVAANAMMPTPMATHNRWSAIGGHLFFLVMAVLAVLYYKERISADSSYYLMNVIDSENFRIEHQRYILAFSQLLPLIGVKIGLSLKAIMILYSLNHVLYFYGLYLYARHYLRDDMAGVAIIFVQVLGVLNMYFCPMYEIWYGTGLVILVYAHARHRRWGDWLSFILFTAITYTALFAHPLLFIPVLFVLLFNATEQFYVRWTHLVFIVVVFASWYLIKKAMLSEYEAGKLSLLDTKNNHSWEDLFKLSYLWGLVKFFFTYYTVPVLMYCCVIVFYILRRVWYKALLISAFFLGHIALINVTHVNDPELSLYFERMYMPLIPICLIPFLYDVFVMTSLRNAAGTVLVALVVGWRIWCFVDVGKDYVAHVNILQSMKNAAHAKSGDSKFEMAASDFKKCERWLDWSTTMQIMLFSGLDGPDKALSIVTPDDMAWDNNRTKLTPNDYLFRCFDRRKDEQINTTYFRLKHGPYVSLPAVLH